MNAALLISDAVGHWSFIYLAQVRSEAAYGRNGWTERGTCAFQMNFMRLCRRYIFIVNDATKNIVVDMQETLLYLNIAATVSQLATSLVSWVGVNPMIAGPCECSSDTKPFDRSSSKENVRVEIPACVAAYDRAREGHK